jgi:hypothetical protein
VAQIQLTDFVLLRAAFQMWPRGGALGDAPDDRPYTYPEGDLLSLTPVTVKDDQGFVLFLKAELNAEELPFQLDVQIGARFVLEPNASLTVDEVEQTLVWLSYPYLRELVANITARAPIPQYLLPPLSRLPHRSLLTE